VTRAGRGRLSEREADAVLAAVQKLRIDNSEMARNAHAEFVGLERSGFSVLPAERRHILEGMRALYGGCVITPSSNGLNPDDQLQSLGPHPIS
jgi:hypothetical protein